MSSICFKRGFFEWTVGFTERRSENNPQFSYKGKKFYLEFYNLNGRCGVDMVVESAEAMLQRVTVHVEDSHGNALSLSSSWCRDPDPVLKVATIWQSDESAIRNVNNTGYLIFLVNFFSDKVELTEPVPYKGFTVRGEEKSIQTSPYMDVLPCLESLSEDLSQLVELDKGPEPDVVLTCGDLQLKAHRNILCARSQVFVAMLNSDMAENRTSTVNIQDMDRELFDQFVRYLYSGKLAHLTVDLAKSLYEAGDKYAVKALMRRCASYLFENLDLENVCEMLVLADLHSDADFKVSIMEYILQKEIHLLQDDRWLTFCNDQPMLANEVLNLYCCRQQRMK